MNRTRALLATFLVLNLLVSAVPIVAFADNHDENWTDGPGRIEDDNRNGINRDIYVTLWNLDKDIKDASANPTYEVSDSELNDSDLNWKEKANLAEEIDFSSRTHPGVVQNWNEDSKDAYEKELNKQGDGESWVPPKDTDDTKDGMFIRDAYIGLYSIDPSTHIYDSETRNDNLYAKPSGDVVAVIEYRTAPPDDTNPHKEFIWNQKYSEIKYHQLSKTPNCDNKQCRLGKDTKDEHVRLLEYGGLSNKVNGKTTLYLEGKIETKWQKKVKICGEPDDPDGDGIRSSQDAAPFSAEDFDGYEDGDGDPEPCPCEDDGDGGAKGTSTPTESSSSSGGDSLAQPPLDAQYSGIGTSGVRYSHDNNLDQDGSCDNWVRAPELDQTLTRSVTVTNDFTVNIQNQPSATVKYAEFPNKYEVYMKTDGDIWTYAELPSQTSVSSGWRIFSSREPSYTKLNSYNGRPPSQQVVPRNPPLRVSVYPDGSGVQAFDEKKGEGALKPSIRKVSGPKMDTPKLPRNLAFATHTTDTFTNPQTVVLEYSSKSEFKPNQPVVIHGVLENSKVRKNADVRKVHKAIVDAKVVSQNSEEDTVTLQIELKDKNGNPISTEGRDGYVSVMGEKVQIDSDGKVTRQFDTGPAPQNFRVIYHPKPWYEVAEDKKAYTQSQEFVPSKNPIDIQDLVYILFQGLVIFGGIYMAIHRALLKVFGIDISGPVNEFIDELFDIIGYVFELLTPK